MSFKKTYTKLLKKTVSTTNRTLQIINIDKIAQKLSVAKSKAERKLLEFDSILEDKLKSYETPLQPVESVQPENADVTGNATIKTTRPIGELNLNVHSLNALRSNNIETVEQLKALTDKELLTLKGVGKKTFEDIKSVLKDI